MAGLIGQLHMFLEGFNIFEKYIEPYSFPNRNPLYKMFKKEKH